MTPICSKLIFRKVLNKSAKNVLLNSIADYSNEWIVGLWGPLLVIFSDINMVEMKNDVVIPSKPSEIFRWH